MSFTNFSSTKSLICAVMLIISAHISMAQSYYHTPNDSIVASAVFDDVSVYNILQNHTGNDTLVFKWKKNHINLPSTWEASICDVGHCYANIVDSSTGDSVYPGDVGIISLHLNPHFESGTGIVQVLFWEIKTPNKIDTLTWIITSNSSSGLNNVLENKLKLFPNPCNNVLTLETVFDRAFSLLIYDLNGKEIFNKIYSENKIELDISDFKNGVYTLQLIYDNAIINKKIIKK